MSKDYCQLEKTRGFFGGSGLKNLPANARDAGLIPGSGRSPGEGNCNPLQYSCLGNPMDTGAWQATVHRVTKSQTQLSDFTHPLKDKSGLPWWLSGRESSCSAGAAGVVGSIPGSGRSPGGGNGTLQYSHLGNPMDRGAWRATAHGVTKESDMTQQLNNKR